MLYRRSAIALFVLLSCLPLLCPRALAGENFLDRIRRDLEREESARETSVSEVLRSVPCSRARGRIAIVVGEDYVNAHEVELGEAYHFLGSVLHEKFAELGFEPIDRKRVRSAIVARQRRLILSGNIIAAMNAGRGLGASLTLTGRVSSRAHDIDVVETNLESFHLSMEFKLIHWGGRILAATSSTAVVAGMDQVASTIELFKERTGPVAAEIYRQYCEGRR
jgi:hypothetical protein